MVDYRLIYDVLKTAPEGEWVGILCVALKNSVERELFEDCIYFATMSSCNATKEQDEREKQGLPRVKGYNLGP